MKATKLVRVLLGADGRPSKIFRDRSWRDFSPELIAEMTKADAVKSIREQVFDWSKNPLTGQFECANCGRVITWKSGEMHESLPKGSGGEVSIWNCEALCRDCHTGSPDSAHGNRRWKTAKLGPTKGVYD